MVFDQAGTRVSFHDFLPFGEEIPSGTNGRSSLWGSATAVTQKFTGKERDAETGVDFFQARYYSAAQGQLTSPDEWAGGIVDPFTGGPVGRPGPLPYTDISDPQTINKYAYVRNNPLRHTDPDGHVIDTLADIWVHRLRHLRNRQGRRNDYERLDARRGCGRRCCSVRTGLGAAVRAEHAIEAGVHIAEAKRIRPKEPQPK